MGAIGGSVFHAIKGFRSAPVVSKPAAEVLWMELPSAYVHPALFLPGITPKVHW